MSDKDKLNDLGQMMNEYFNNQATKINNIVSGEELSLEQEEKRDRALQIIKELESDEDILLHFSNLVKLSKIKNWI